MQKDTHGGMKKSIWFYTAAILLLFYYFPCSENPSEASSMQFAEHTHILYRSFYVPSILIPFHLYKCFCL